MRRYRLSRFTVVFFAVALLMGPIAVWGCGTAVPMERNVTPAVEPKAAPEEMPMSHRLHAECVESIGAEKCGEPDRFRNFIVPDGTRYEIYEDDNGEVTIQCYPENQEGACYRANAGGERELSSQNISPTPPLITQTPTTIPTISPLTLAAKQMWRECRNGVSEKLSKHCGEATEWEALTLFWPYKFDTTDFILYGDDWVPVNSRQGKETDNILRPSNSLTWILSRDYVMPIHKCYIRTGGPCKNIPTVINEFALDPVRGCMGQQKGNVITAYFFSQDLVALARGIRKDATSCWAWQ